MKPTLPTARRAGRRAAPKPTRIPAEDRARHSLDEGLS